MSKYNEIIALLNQKLQLFVNYKNATISAIDAEDDAKLDYITKRDELAIEIDELTIKINKSDIITSNLRARELLYCKPDFGSLTKDEQAFYAVAKEIFGVLASIQELNGELSSLLKARQEFYKTRIGETKNTPKIARYLQNAKINGNSPNFMNNKST